MPNIEKETSEQIQELQQNDFSKEANKLEKEIFHL